MPGINPTGKPNTNDYNLGRGKVYFADILSDGSPGAYRDLGNSPEFNITVESETLEHQSSMQGLRVTDNEVVISQKVGLSITLDEINFQNLAMFVSGDYSTGPTNPAVAGITSYSWITTAKHGGVTLGAWYDVVDPNGVRAYDIKGADLILTEPVGPTVLVENTDYTVDEHMGRVFFLTTASNIVDADDCDLELTANVTAAATDEVRALTKSEFSGALKFVSENPADADHQTEYQFHQVQLQAEGDFGLISDEFTQMQMTGTAETNTDADPDSPTLTIRTHENARAT
ncbi:MAG: hypothetical protein GY906_12985 [bacterium]|nr:hypothetical protein [bacterium]